MGARDGAAIGRLLKLCAFVQFLDSRAAAGASATAAETVHQLETATPDDWANLAAQLNEKLGKKDGEGYATPSAATQAGLIALYRQRAQLPVADLDALQLAIDAERRLLKLASGETDADAALADRYVTIIDKRATGKGNDPTDPATAAAIVTRLTDYRCLGEWISLRIDLRERWTPNANVQRLVANIYRARAGQLTQIEAAPAVQRLCACGAPALPNFAECAACDLKLVSGELLDPARRAEARQELIDDDRARARRKAGGR